LHQVSVEDEKELVGRNFTFQFKKANIGKIVKTSQNSLLQAL